jgi:mono/diheme cytochrome c family protein
MEKKIWGLMLAAFVAVSLSACSGDASANGGDEADAAPDQAQVTAAPEAEADAGMAEDAAMPQELPEGVTPEMVAEGKQIFSGAGICMSCHGPNGEGIPNLGANLTDDEWLHIDGSYESIVQNILNGVSAQESSSGVPMPPKGGTAITDEQVRAVAAYVWTLSH